MAARFWVGGTGTWDASDTTHWAASSGTAGGQSVPGSADTVTFDGSSGGGTVTVNVPGGITIQSYTFGAFTGTIDHATNNQDVTITGASGSALSGTGTATRTFNMGSGTWTINATALATMVNFATITGLTLSAASCNLVLGGTNNGRRTITCGASTTWGNITFGGGGAGVYALVGVQTFNNVTIDASTSAKTILMASGTYTVSGTLSVTGSSVSRPVMIAINSDTGTTTIAHAAAMSLDWCVLRQMAFTGAGAKTATNSLDMGNNSGITITNPSVGGGTGASRSRVFTGF